MRAGGRLSTSLTPIDDLAALEGEWRALEASASASFFLSWEWIGSLLHAMPNESRPLLVRVLSADETVAMGLLGASRSRRRRLIHSRGLHLNETGRSEYDGITIEHNGLLARQDIAPAATSAVVTALAEDDRWDELHLSGLESLRQSEWIEAAQDSGLNYRVQWEKAYHFVDLDRIRVAGKEYLEGLSANTRQQIRRSMKLYGARGPLRLRQAASLAEATRWLVELSELHQRYWTARGWAGAFATDFARRFHHSVVTEGWPRNVAQIVQVAAGDSTVGYAYNLQAGGTLYNYQTGLQFEDDPKLKPGLVCHALIVADALDRGLRTYDLLAGGSQYKRSLANAEGKMVWPVIQKRRLAFRVEDWARAAHARFVRRS